MGVGLSYWTLEEVDDDVRAQITRDAARIARDWWCEPIHFFPWPGKPGLAGDTKLFFAGGFSTAEGDFVEVAPEEEAFLAARDARFIVEQLARWSAAFGLTWELSLMEPLGRVAGGVIEPRVLAFLDELAASAGATGTAADDARATQLLAQYAARAD